MDHGSRRLKLVGTLDDREVDAVLVTRLANVRYLTGFTGSNGQTLVAASESVFFTDGRYIEQSRLECPDVERVICLDGLGGPLAEQCERLGLRRLGFEAHDVTVAGLERLRKDLPDVDVRPIGELVERLRWVKDADELHALRSAQAATDQAFEETLGRVALGMTERQVALEIENGMRRAGADGPAFDSIVAFGENAAQPHHEPNHRALDEGDVIKMDFGALWSGYHADMTRTISFGEPPAELRKIHDVVREAQEAGFDAVRAGATGGDVDRAARAVVDEAGYGRYFTHGLGHGVGLEIHEGPNFRPKGTDVLPAGAVMTIEPGVYVPGLGGVRIEDMVEVREDGCRVLGASIRELVEI